ncbi:MAG: hypothetical protein KDD44_01095, partial [Bdellovibrionales bacterium]|nr:hypothetical protein [Bdellovibrionales bacterium]
VYFAANLEQRQDAGWGPVAAFALTLTNDVIYLYVAPPHDPAKLQALLVGAWFKHQRIEPVEPLASGVRLVAESLATKGWNAEYAGLLARDGKEIVRRVAAGEEVLPEELGAVVWAQAFSFFRGLEMPLAELGRLTAEEYRKLPGIGDAVNFVVMVEDGMAKQR